MYALNATRSAASCRNVIDIGACNVVAASSANNRVGSRNMTLATFVAMPAAAVDVVDAVAIVVVGVAA